MDEIYLALDEAVDNVFVSSFKDFLGQNLSVDRWVIVSDFNFDSPGSRHDVLAFSLFPVRSGGLRETCDKIQSVLNEDFKNTGRITKKMREIPKNIDVFSFVILLNRPFKLLRSGDAAMDRAGIHQAINHLLYSKYQNIEQFPPGMQMLMLESQKKNFSLKMMERMLILAKMYAVLSKRLQCISLIRLIYWLPDRDNLTTYCDSAWWELAKIELMEKCAQIKKEKIAEIGIIRPKNADEQDKFDPLIRIPDYLAAAFSRWDITNNVILPPSGSKSKILDRYANIIAHWFADNPRIWVSRIHLENDFIRTRVITGVRTKRRLRRYSLS